MAMTEETKRRLAEAAKKKRAKNPKPGDFSSLAWATACAVALESEPPVGVEPSDWLESYLRYVPAEQADEVARWLPFREVTIGGGPAMRTVKAFPFWMLRAVLNHLNLEMDKYAGDVPHERKPDDRRPLLLVRI